MELWFQVPQSGDTETLYRFQKAIGGLGKVRGPWKYGARMLPMYRLDLRGYIEVQTAIAMLWRFLSGPKRRQAWKAMNECKAYVQMRALHGKGPAQLTLVQADALRSEYASLKIGRKRIRRGAREELVAKYGLVSINTLAAICSGRGYKRKEVANGV